MPIITTKVLGLGGTEADPKPVMEFDYAGQPIRRGTPYNGRPEHTQSNESSCDESNKSSVLQRLLNKSDPDVKRGPGRPHKDGTPAARKRLSRQEIAARIRAGQARARAAGKIFGFKFQRDRQAAEAAKT